MSNLFGNLGLLLGMGEAGASSDPLQQFMPFIMFGLIIVVFYFMIIRPQSKKQKDTKKMLDTLKKGDKIQTIGGLRGIVWALKDDSVVIKTDETVKLEFVRSAIATVLEQKPADDNTAAIEDKSTEEAKPAKAPRSSKPKAD